MQDWDVDWIGGRWLQDTAGVPLVSTLPVESCIARRRATHKREETRQEHYVEVMRPAGTWAGHLQFHLRHEVPNLELLSRLFTTVGGDFVAEWVNREPTGQYARRAGFLFEWLTGTQLAVPPRATLNYIDALDGDLVVVASPDRVVRDRRWRVNDNMPGTRFFCPVIVKDTASFHAAISLDVAGWVQSLSDEFGEDIILRSAVWLTLRESRSSFAIEGEADQMTRIQRFGRVMAERTGVGDVPLGGTALASLQSEILGARSTVVQFGVRRSPVYVGETLGGREVVHYVAPPHTDMDAMLDGLATFLHRTESQSSVMRCTVASFGFVYIHPLADGNGRAHRFLVNDILRRDGVVPEPIIIPVSATIAEDRSERKRYDAVLDSVSAPLMRLMDDNVTFGPQVTNPDGIRSNIDVDDPDLARPAWRHPDFSAHLSFMARILETTLRDGMREEARFLREHAAKRDALKEVLEMTNQQADRILRSLTNGNTLSNSLRKDIIQLEEPGLWEELVAAVRQAENRLSETTGEGAEPSA